MDSLRVADVMNPKVISISDEATLADAIEKLRQHRISALVVVDHSGHMVGVISQTDLIRAFQEHAGDPQVLQRPVSAYMTRDVISCAPHKSLAYAMRLLNQHRIHRLVVVQTHDGGRFVTDRMIPVGILSQTDIVRALMDRFETSEDRDETTVSR
ncbi:HPP family protein [Kallotenue papyrolyticum]|uniref:CBS domain-containing protein n=1 Tax=Kallotenue papyrolyticum TaxID=1325125 RepID=UPI0004923ACB|nr:CBS domain-containing protein [Kallotenue papyrolyticum]